MFIRKTGHWLAATALCAMIPVEASLAAETPITAAAAIMPAYYDWSGVYVGAHAGYGGGMKDWFEAGANFAAKGLLGGGQIGINKQIASLVFGLELDGSWADIKGSQTLSVGGPAIGLQVIGTATSKIDGLVTFAGRAGLAADRWFVFAKGGLGLAHESHAFSGTEIDILGTQSSAVNATEYRVGPTAGVGAEYALGNNWSMKAEYNVIHFGSRTVTLNGSQANPAAPLSLDTRIEQNAIHLAKVGVNYRFGGINVDPSFAQIPAASGTNWSGAYIGAQGGYGFGHTEWPDFADPTTPDSGKYDVKGWLAGGTVGVNAQAGAFVFGVEGEWMWTGIKGSQTMSVDAGAGATLTFGLATKVNWLAIAAARAGFVVGDKLMIYGKAGVALADETHTFGETFSAGPASITDQLSARALHTGVVTGAGAEYALGNNWSAKFEYDYIRMLGQAYTGTGFESANAPPVAVGTIDFFSSFSKMSQDLHIIKLGVNYHFNPMPVVVSARY